MRMIITAIFLTFSPTISASEISFDESATKAFCERLFSDRGVLDESAFNSCFSKQREGFDEIGYLYEKHTTVEPVELIDELLAYSVRQWTNGRRVDYGFVAFVLKQNAEAYLDIEWYIENGDASPETVQKCRSIWISKDSPEWNRTLQCIRREDNF